ncbi:MAG: hypothetical protein AAF871_09730 [Pseudomonadota bacterium]
MNEPLPPLTEIDPRGLIADAFAMEGLGLSECRTIFLDWAVWLPDGVDAAALLPALSAHYAHMDPAHPMRQVLNEGLDTAEAPARRGGAKARRRD